MDGVHERGGERRWVGRGDILSNLGMPELVGRNAEEFLEIAAGLAGDMERMRFCGELAGVDEGVGR